MPDFSPLLSRLLRIRPYEVELLRPSRQAPPLAWLLLLCGLLALAAAATLVQPAWRRHQELVAQLATAEASLAQATDTPANSAEKSRKRAATRGAERSELAEAAGIVRELNRPWQALFAQIEAADSAQDAGVHLIQMNVDARFATLQLVVESRELDKLVRFSQHLAGAGPIRSMTMSHHEWRDTLGAHVVNAAMQGQLDGGDSSEAPAK